MEYMEARNMEKRCAVIEITIKFPRSSALEKGTIRKIIERIEEETAQAKICPQVKLIFK